jgi:hypothetical protein
VAWTEYSLRSFTRLPNLRFDGMRCPIPRRSNTYVCSSRLPRLSVFVFWLKPSILLALRWQGRCTDHLAEDEAHALSIVRDIMGATVPPTDAWAPDASELGGLNGWDEPSGAASELRGFAFQEQQIDAVDIIGRIFDRDSFRHFKEHFGTTLVTGVRHLQVIDLVGRKRCSFDRGDGPLL